MTHFKKISFTMLLVLSVLAVVFFIYGFIDINKKFPQPQKELHEAGEYVDYLDRIKIKGISADYFTNEEYKEKYEIKEQVKHDCIIVKLYVLNESDKPMDMAYFNQLFNFVIYPAGYENQGIVLGENTIINSNEEKEIEIMYAVSNAILEKNKISSVLKQEGYFCLKAYPVIQAIVFKEIGINEKN